MEEKHWPWILVVVAIVCTTVIICFAVAGYNRRITTMMEKGYEETAYPAGASYYQKAK